MSVCVAVCTRTFVYIAMVTVGSCGCVARSDCWRSDTFCPECRNQTSLEGGKDSSHQLVSNSLSYLNSQGIS